MTKILYVEDNEGSENRLGSRGCEAGGRASFIEALNLAPDFLENLVSNNLFDALSRGI
jgi:hypothetical protein